MFEKRHLAKLISVLTALALANLILRAFLGRGEGEEAFFPAMAYRFILGDKPFLTEVSPLQFTGVLLLPFLRIYRWIVPDLSGVILLFRFLYVLTTVGTGLVVGGFVRSLTGKPALALGAAAFSLSFEPFYFHFNSHAILGERLFLIGILCGARSLLRPSPPSFWIAAALTLALAILVYPPLFYGGAAFGVALLVLSAREERIKTALTFGGTLALLLSGAVAASYATGYTHRFTEFMGTFRSAGVAIRLTNLVLIHLPNRWLLVAVAAAAFAVYRYRPRATAPFAAAIVPLLFFLTPSVNFKCQNWVLAFGLMPALLYPLVRHRAETRPLLWALFFPSITAAVATTCLSNAGALMGGYGMTPAALVSILFLYWALSAEPQAAYAGEMRAALLAFLVVANMVTNPRPIEGEWIRDRGPNAGLLAEPAAAAEEMKLRSALNEVPPTSKTIVSYPPESLDYLMTPLRPLTPTVLSGSDNVNGYLVRHHLAYLPRVDVFIRRLDRDCPGTPSECRDVRDLERRLDLALSESHSLYREFTFAKIYVRKPSL